MTTDQKVIERPTPPEGSKLCGFPKKTGGTCTKVKGWGTPHLGFGYCRTHEKNNPNLKKKAMGDMAAAAVITYGLPRNVDPHTALLEEVYRTAGIVDYLQKRVREMTQEELVWGKIGEELIRARAARAEENGEIVMLNEPERIEKMVRSRVNMASGASVWLVQYEKERKHLVEVCRAAIACGVAERQVKLAEQHNQLFAIAMSRILADLGIDQARDEVRAVMRKNLLLLAAENPQ